MTPLVKAIKAGLKEAFDSQWKAFSTELGKEMHYSLSRTPKLTIEITGPDMEPWKALPVDLLVSNTIEGIATCWEEPYGTEELNALASECERLAKRFSAAAAAAAKEKK